jgi:hypothetical protein
MLGEDCDASAMFAAFYGAEKAAKHMRRSEDVSVDEQQYHEAVRAPCPMTPWPKESADRRRRHLGTPESGNTAPRPPSARRGEHRELRTCGGSIRPRCYTRRASRSAGRREGQRRTTLTFSTVVPFLRC